MLNDWHSRPWLEVLVHLLEVCTHQAVIIGPLRDLHLQRAHQFLLQCCTILAPPYLPASQHFVHSIRILVRPLLLHVGEAEIFPFAIVFMRSNK